LAAPADAVPWPLVEELDRAAIRVVTDLAGAPADPARVRRILRGCAGVVWAGAPRPAGLDDWLPPVQLDPRGGVLADFCAAVLGERARIRPYAFFIGRLERDFRHAREAIRAAVEAEAGVPCLWIDDGRHATNVESVREQTRLLIKHASFVIADLTLGVESPERENPSRAHEIGMAIAYERPLMLCSQEPRRYPYFSIGDMQMMFWLTEDELEAGVREWVGVNRRLVGLQVLNYRLPAPILARPTFTYDPGQRYVGPKTRGARGRRLRARWG